jgi:hypothetical protein
MLRTIQKCAPLNPAGKCSQRLWNSTKCGHAGRLQASGCNQWDPLAWQDGGNKDCGDRDGCSASLEAQSLTTVLLLVIRQGGPQCISQ